MPPRAQLMMRTPFFMFANAAAPTSPRVSAVSGVCTVMKSERRKISSRPTSSMRSRVGRLARHDRIEADHLHLQALRAIGDDAADVAEAR